MVSPVYVVSHPCGKLVTQDVNQVNQFIDTFYEGTGVTLKAYIDEAVYNQDEVPFYSDPSEWSDR